MSTALVARVTLDRHEDRRVKILKSGDHIAMARAFKIIADHCHANPNATPASIRETAMNLARTHVEAAGSIQDTL